MTQEELKEQFLKYAYNNLQKETVLEAIFELLNIISSEFYKEGYRKDSIILDISKMIVGKVLESEG